MRGASFFKSTAVRLAIIYISLFVVSYLGANVIAYQMVLNYLDNRLNSNVMERYREIETAYGTRGPTGAVNMINSHGPAIREQETIYTLRNPDGDLLAGNAAIDGVPNGFSTLQPKDQHENATPYKLFRGRLGENDLVVGISYGDTDQLARIVLVSFGWTTAIVFAVGIGGAAVLTYRMRRRIFTLSQTAHAIGHGELSRRLPVSSRMDEIDVLSSEVNVALTRLEASVTALKQVTTDIAHDLKTPIGRTFLVLDDALQAETVDDVKNAVEVALGELRSIADTFDALLRIAQIESRSRTAHFGMVDLNALVRDIFEIHEAIASDEGYSLRFREAETNCHLSGDPDLVSQMLVNLLANAMRHTPAGSTIVLEVARRADLIYLTVSDNGPGIPEEERVRVFDRFYRLEKSRTTTGSGLGLSLVKAIADLHRATVALYDSAPGLTVAVAFPSVEIWP
ncbi:ATP-binding protein [Rhizobium sp. LC145]|uniref:sensor histidine kinase n=1 Tax=Rhizobium sp. LC145 TaxID=1120688 RepID=UPI00062A2430|nr:ATP-binding protein [Rhizobium sp. LC145]KKX29441.1 ATPase [Rhizobium sp. LC145]MDX3927983.1 ATP-binding protein [Shinella sp.]TKT66181.1 HAMP domain-containing protein [Rhizobiaceae bacterium LC148]